MTIAEFWPLCLQHLKQQLSTQQYSMWIAPLTVGEENGQWLVYTPNNFLFGHVKKQFWPHIQAAKAELAPADAPDLALKIGQGLRLEAAGNAAPAAVNTTAKQAPSAEQIIGKHIATIPYIGWPGVLLQQSGGDVQVETGGTEPTFLDKLASKYIESQTQNPAGDGKGD